MFRIKEEFMRITYRMFFVVWRLGDFELKDGAAMLADGTVFCLCFGPACSCVLLCSLLSSSVL